MRGFLIRICGSCTIGLVALALGSCGGGGGGGGGSSAIPAFDLQTGVVATDLDGDGRVDVAVANTHVAGPPPHPGTARVYLHSDAGPRSFLLPARYDFGADPWGLVAADLNSDGVRDLVSASPTTDQLWLLEQDPARPGRFLTGRSFATPRAPYEAAVADLDGDGRNDLLLASASLDPARAGVYLALQDAVVEGTFRPAVRLDAGQKPAHVVPADLDGDGRMDLVVTNGAIDGKGSGVTVLLADAARPGQFLPPIFHAMSDAGRSSCVADFNADGRPDVAVAAAVTRLVNDLQSVVVLYLQDPTRPGRFIRAGRYASGDQVTYLAAADLDGDGAVDVVTDEGPEVLYNDPARPGTLAASRPL